ncbi:hypothetical protein pb186bvf_008876 [Paramecium bursaria]
MFLVMIHQKLKEDLIKSANTIFYNLFLQYGNYQHKEDQQIII